MITPGKACTACGACVQKCPKACITMAEDENGFLYPQVNAEKCIKCGLCDGVCHLNTDVRNPETRAAVACAHRDRTVLKNSSSGGAFTALAERIFSRGGVVYGAAYITPTQPQHARVEWIEELQKLRGSKYVQSMIGDTYRQAQADLLSGRWVLFTGTPCQIAGLKAFLGKPYDTLVTADIICHGVPSAAYFGKFVKGYETKHGCAVREFDFRSKENTGWSCAGIYRTEKNGRQKKRKAYYFNGYYYFYFLEGEIYRDSCYECRYTNLHRPGDFTLGDFLGAEGQALGFDAADGCSLVLLNTEKAESIFRELNVYSAKADLAFAVANNAQLRGPSRHSALRAALLQEYRECTAAEAQKRFAKRFRLARAKARVKYCLPGKVRKLLQKHRYSAK